MLSFVSNDPAENTDYSLNFLRSWRSFLIVLADVKVGIFYVYLYVASLCCEIHDKHKLFEFICILLSLFYFRIQPSLSKMTK